MPELSKFQIATIVFIFMFIFVVGAMYSNTKDIAEVKQNENKMISGMEQSAALRADENTLSSNTDKIEYLSDRINNLEQKLNSMGDIQQSSQNGGLRCRIYGIMDGNVDIQMTPTQAVREAQENGSEMVVLCSF